MEKSDKTHFSSYHSPVSRQHCYKLASLSMTLKYSTFHTIFSVTFCNLQFGVVWPTLRSPSHLLSYSDLTPPLIGQSLHLSAFWLAVSLWHQRQAHWMSCRPVWMCPLVTCEQRHKNFRKRVSVSSLQNFNPSQYCNFRVHVRGFWAVTGTVSLGQSLNDSTANWKITTNDYHV